MAATNGAVFAYRECPYQDATQASAVRLITVDRPGIGGSDVQLGLTVGGWASDVAELSA